MWNLWWSIFKPLKLESGGRRVWWCRFGDGPAILLSLQGNWKTSRLGLGDLPMGLMWSLPDQPFQKVEKVRVAACGKRDFVSIFFWSLFGNFVWQHAVEEFFCTINSLQILPRCAFHEFIGQVQVAADTNAGLCAGHLDLLVIITSQDELRTTKAGTQTDTEACPTQPGTSTWIQDADLFHFLPEPTFFGKLFWSMLEVQHSNKKLHHNNTTSQIYRL